MSSDTRDTLHPRVETTTEIVATYVSQKSVPVCDPPNLIRSGHDSHSKPGTAPPVEASAGRREPAVSIHTSVTDEFIVSLED